MILNFNFDTANLATRLREGLSAANVDNAFTQLGAMIVNDAVTKPPTPRIDTGNLRGSWSIALAGRLFNKGNSQGQLSPDTNGMQKFELRVGFNMPYASIMESGMRKGKAIGFGVKSQRATPRTGNHFLETKIKNKQRIYLKFLQEKLI